MKLGVSLRAMGKASTRNILVDCARAAEAADVDDLWLPDHIAIPPDDAEGSAKITSAPHGHGIPSSLCFGSARGGAAG